MAGRIVVLISGTGSNMEALVQACRRGDVEGDVVAVVADRDCLGLKIAEGYDIPTVFLDPSEYPSREEWSAALSDRVGGFEPDLVVSAGFMRILSPVFVDTFEGRLINLHPSLLPAFPGAHAVRDALEAGVKETGTTVHFIDHEVDHGPIIVQARVPIAADDDVAALHERIKDVEHELLPRAVRMFLAGEVALPTGKAET
ncbi:MAG TPA: phosphoribosylglycinamide formyltransferase [Actinomycetota bacterium]|nr:phosphoribosylglycinamide formyltransferase [Actinomycetota bacterium]